MWTVYGLQLQTDGLLEMNIDGSFNYILVI